MFNRHKELGPTVVGVDLGSSSIKLAYVQDGIPLLMEQQALPLGAMERGRIVDADAVEHALRELWKRSDLSLREMWMVFANQATIIRKWTLVDLGNEEDLAQAVETNASSILDPYDPDNSVLDASELERDPGSDVITLLLAAAEHSDVSAYQASAKKAKLSVAGSEPTAVALRHAYDIDSETPTAIVGIGAELTTVAVAHKNAVVYLRVIPIGGNDFTKAVQSVEGAGSFELCETLKKHIGLDPVSDDEKLDMRIVRDAQSRMMLVAEQLIQEVGISIDHYHKTDNAPSIEQGLLCGGGSRLKGLRGLFHEYGQPSDEPKVARWASGVPNIDVYGCALGASMDRTFDLTAHGKPRKAKKAKATKNKKDDKGKKDSKSKAAATAPRGKRADKKSDDDGSSTYKVTALVALISILLLGGAWQYFKRDTASQQDAERQTRAQITQVQQDTSGKLEAPEDFLQRNEAATQLVEERNQVSQRASLIVSAALKSGATLTQMQVDQAADQPFILGGVANDSAYAKLNTQLQVIGEVSEIDRSGNSFRLSITPNGGAS